MPLTYAQIRRQQRLFGSQYADLSPDEFAQVMNNMTGTNEYDAATGNGLGSLLKAGSYGIDQALEATRLPYLAGEVGGTLFGESGREAFHGLPRMAVDMLPFMRAGKLATAAGAAMMGANTYEKTNSAVAGLLSAATAPLFGPAQKLGGEAAVGLAGKFGLNTARTEAMAASAGGLGLLSGEAATNAVANKFATQLAAGGVLKSGLARGVEQVGEQAGIAAANLAGQTITTAAAAPSGQRWDAVKGMWTDGHWKQTLVGTALTQLPFMGMGLAKALGPQRAEVNYVAKYGDTIRKYDEAVYGPQRQQLALFTPPVERRDLSKNPLSASFQEPLSTSSQQAITDVVNAVNSNLPTMPERNVGVRGVGVELGTASAGQPKTPPVEARMLRLKALRDQAARDNNPAAMAFYGELANKVADANGVSPLDPVVIGGLSSEDPAVRIESSMIVNGTTPEVLSAKTTKLEQKGMSTDEAAREVAAAETLKAKEQAVKLTAKQKQREAAKQETERRRQEQAANEAARFDLLIADNDNVSAVIKTALGFAARSDDVTKQTSVQRAALAWEEQYGRDEAKLPELKRMLGGVTSTAGLRQPNHKSRMVVTNADPANTSVGAGNEAQVFKTVEEANAARDAIKASPDGNKFLWTVEAKDTKAKGKHFIISRKEWANTSVQAGGKEAVDQTLTPDEIVAMADNKQGDDLAQRGFAQMNDTETSTTRAVEAVDESAREPGEELGAEVVAEKLTEMDTYVSSLDDKAAAEMGDGDPSKGRARLQAQFDIYIAHKAGRKMQDIVTTDFKNLWKTYKDYLQWIDSGSVMDHLFALQDRMSKVVANKGKQFLSLTGAFAAGDGFFFNVVPLQNGKLGKHSIPKNGVVSVEQFRKIGRGTDQPLTNDEIALYQQLVPEAFGVKAKDGVVFDNGTGEIARTANTINLPLFYETLPKREPTIEIKKLGEGGLPQQIADYNKMRHEWYDALTSGERDVVDTNDFGYARGRLGQSDWQKMQEWYKLKQFADNYDFADASQFGYVAPKAESDMPGYVEGLVRVPIQKSEPKSVGNSSVSFNEPPLYRGPHFGSEDTNVIGFFRGFVDTLPDGTPLWHRIEQQTDVVVSHGEGENKTFTVRDHPEFGTFKSKNEAFEAAKKLHPLFGAYVEMTTKAEMLHIQKLNKERAAKDLPLIKKIFTPDAETAMMSEMHDVAGNLTEGRPSQEKGMRLHYDTTLPSELRKITGDKGQRIDLGVHEKAKAASAESDTAFLQGGGWQTHTQDRSVVKGSPVFKDASGNPKTNITGTLYDISNVKTAESGSGQTFGQQQPVFVGERQALGQLLRNVGVDERMVPEVSRLVSLWDNNDIAYAQLQTGEQAAGLFTQQTDGQKLVWLAASGDPASRKVFVLAHELNGHGLWKAMEEGKLDSETTRKLTEYARHIGENTPEQNSILLRELWGTLPKRYRKDDGLQKMVNSRLEDPEEVLANMNAIVSLALVNKGRPGWINEVMTWLPKPIGDAIGVFAKWGRKVFESISGLMFMRRQNWTRGTVDPKELGQLHDYVKTLHSVLKADRNREAMTEYAVRQEMATDPRALMNSLVDGGLWEDGVTTAGNQLVQEFRLLKEKDKVNPVREALGKVNRGLNHLLQPLVNYAQTMPWLRQTVVSGAVRQMDKNRMELSILKEMGLKRDGFAFRWDKDSPTQKVMQSPRLATALNELVWRANPMEQTVEQLIASGDSVVMKTLGKLSSAEQQTVRETIARHEVANSRLNEMVREQEYERLAYATAETLMIRDATLQQEPAEQQARQLVEAVKAGTPIPHDVSEFVSKQAARIEKKFTEFSNRPYFISARRFGDHAVKIVKADGTYSVENFYTSEALQSWMATNHDRIQSKELTIYRLKPEEAVSVNVGKSLLELIKDREEERRPQIVEELTKAGLEQSQAEAIAARFSEAADLQQEIQAKLVPSMTPHRKFVDGYQNLSALRQQIEYVQMVMHSITKGVDTARFSMGMMDPRVRNTPEAASIKQAWLQNKAPDMKGTRLLQRAGYTWFMSAHLINMLQDATNALSGALWGNLIADGGGVVGTGKRIMTAMRDVKAKSRQTVYEQQMLQRYREGNQGLGSFSDDANNDYLASINALESANGQRISGLGDLLAKPLHSGFLAMRNFHKHFTDFGMESGMLATFRHFKAKGLSDIQAEKEAFALATVAMGGGKYNRAAGIWASGRLQPLSAMMTMLQGFAYNQMFSAKNWMVKMLGRTPGVTPTQRVDALKAFGVHNGLMFAQAGIFGLPLVAALMAVNDKLFGVNSKEKLASLIQENLDGPDSDVIRQISMHGLVNAFGGVDYATKAQMPGVLGLNPQNGFSLESLFGPAYSLAGTVVDSVKMLAQGDVAGAATNVLPNNFRRALQAYRDDWEFRRKDGSLIAETTTGDKTLYALFGLKPRNVVDLLERDAWQAIDANNERSERSQWLDDMVELFKSDPTTARVQILKRANERGESPAGLATTVADRLLEMQMPRDAGRRPGASEQVNRAAGVMPTTISEVQRVQAQQALLQRLNMGLPATPATYKRALLIDRVRAQSPWISYEEAQRRVNQMMGNDVEHRGEWYGAR